MRPTDVRKLEKREAVDTDYRYTIDKDNNQCLTRQPDKSLTEDEIKALTVRDAEVTDTRLSIDNTGNFILTNQPDNSAIGTAASVDVGTAQDQIETNALKDFKSFDSLTSAIAYVTANPDNIKRLDTASYRNEAECLALSLPYPDGGGFDNYTVVPSGTGSTLQYADAGTKQLKLNHSGDVDVRWFGVVGNCDLLLSSSDTPSGLDETILIKSVCEYVQNLNVFNYARGISNAYTIVFQPSMKVRLTGDNPLGTRLPRLTESSTGTERLVRCNYNINGNGCIFYWKCDAATDRLIESHETLVRQKYSNFTVLQSDMVVGDVKGVLYSNIANINSNGTSWHKFTDVRTDLAGAGFVAATDTGYLRVFQYEGNNLGDKLSTEFCSFRYFQTAFHSSNIEAVSQRFYNTGFYAYMDGAIFFHILEHGSSFTVRDCDLLIKGQDQTLLKLDRASSVAGLDGVGGASAIFNFDSNRTETKDGNRCTFVSADFGVVNYSDSISTAGGLPATDSILFYAHGNAIINADSCVIAGRVASGDYSDASLFIGRNYSINITKSQFIANPDDSIGVYDGVTFTPYYKLQTVDMLTKPIIVRSCNANTCNWQAGTGDELLRMIDFVYNAYGPDQFNDVARSVTLFGVKGSPGYQYPQIIPATDLLILPASCVVDSVKLSGHALFSSVDAMILNIGSAAHSWTITSGDTYRSSSEVMPDHVIVCPSAVDTERTVSITASKSAAPVTTSLKMFITLGVRPCYGNVDNTSGNVESASFRLAKERSAAS